MTAKQYPALFFDMDDTLLDYKAGERAALLDTHEHFQISLEAELFIEAYRRHNVKVWREFEEGRIDQISLREERFRRMQAELGNTILPVEEMSLFYLGRLSRQTMLTEGTLPVLKSLSQRHRMALITNGIAHVQRARFTASLLHRYFMILVISEEAGCAKPDPRIFDAALATLRVRPEEVLFVGDSISSDMAAAANAGIDFCWYNPARIPHPGTLPTLLTIQSLAELPALIVQSGT